MYSISITRESKKTQSTSQQPAEIEPSIQQKHERISEEVSSSQDWKTVTRDAKKDRFVLKPRDEIRYHLKREES